MERERPRRQRPPVQRIDVPVGERALLCERRVELDERVGVVPEEPGPQQRPVRVGRREDGEHDDEGTTQPGDHPR